MRNSILTLIFLAFALYGKTCQCDPPISVKRAYKESGIIATVTVIEILEPIDPIEQIITPNNDTLIKRPVYGYAKKVLISKIYKGEITKDTMIISGNNSSCELRLEIGKTYIIYGEIVKNEIVTNTCTRSGNIQNHIDLGYLERKYKRK